MIAVARRHPATVFFLLAFGLTWAVWVPRALESEGYLESDLFITLGSVWTYGPAIAALLAAALCGGRRGVRELGARLVRWRVRWHWYAVVLALPAVLWAVVLGVLTVAAQPLPTMAPIPLEHGIVTTILLFVILALTDGLGEEAGWRGYALPRQLDRFRPLGASLLLGLLWAAWHLPLFYTEGASLYRGTFPVLVLDLAAMAVLYTWVFQGTHGSALLAVLFHASWNTFTISPSLAQVGSATVVATILILKWVLATVIAVRWTVAARSSGSGHKRTTSRYRRATAG